MELASRVYDIITKRENIHPTVEKVIPEIVGDQKMYWRKVLRAAALCHDLGHIPFSHAAEKELLPEGEDHESITVKLISRLDHIWNKITPPLRKQDIQKIAVGPKKYEDENLSNWEIILSEIITGDAFGVDRMDYLLRDSHHIGVAYGEFDHYRLIDTLRILPKEYEDSKEPALGIEKGGIYNAEALLLARYFMYSQVYMHPIRRIYDLHLKDFMKEWYNLIANNIEEQQNLTDNQVLTDMYKARTNTKGASESAQRIIDRNHFKVLYQRKPSDMKYDPEPGRLIYKAVGEKFGMKNVKYDKYSQSNSPLEFPVLYKNDNTILSSVNISDTIEQVPLVSIENVFVNPEVLDEAYQWLKENKEDILTN